MESPQFQASPQHPQASSLVIVEHRHGALGGATLNTITAAAQLGGPVSALVGGEGVGGVAESVARVEGVEKVRRPSAAAQRRWALTPALRSWQQLGLFCRARPDALTPPSRPHKTLASYVLQQPVQPTTPEYQIPP
jgi:hypothetical protein